MARRSHAASSIDTKVFIFGGIANDQDLSSIEFIDLAAEDSFWAIVDVPLFTMRSYSIVGQTSKDHIAIIGGYHCEDEEVVYNKDFLSFDTRQMTSKSFKCNYHEI